MSEPVPSLCFRHFIPTSGLLYRWLSVDIEVSTSGYVGVEMVLLGLYWCILSKIMMISDELQIQNLRLQESDIDEFISPRCIKLESKLMVQDIIEEERYHRWGWARYLWLSKEIEIWVFLLRISFSYWICSILDGVTSVSSLGFQSFLHKGDARLRSIAVVLFPFKGDPQGS